MRAPKTAGAGKLRDRKIVAELGGALAQIQLWREIAAGSAPPPPDRIDDELLNACQKILGGLGGLAEREAVETLYMELDLHGAMAHVREAQFRTVSAGVARIYEDAHDFGDKAGHDILRGHFPGYDELFPLLGDAVKQRARALLSPGNREEFLAWAARNQSALAGLYKRLLSSQRAAVDAKKRERKNFWLAVLGVAAAVIGAIVAFASLTG